jgi:DNA transposition AAA+ family ATPase
MNHFTGASQMKNTSTWERPLHGPDPKLANRTAENIEQWWGLVDRVIAVARASSWTKTEVARRIGMPDGTFSQWFSGQYAGRLDTQNEKVIQWLASLEEMAELAAAIPASPAFLKLKTSTEILETLAWTQMTADFVGITFGAGMGKTTACRHYRDTRPHVFLATVSPHTKTTHGMLNELAAELDVHVLNPAKLVRAIGQRLRRAGGNPLLIVDEAQNLTDDAINQLRHFSDNYNCGVALVGNGEIYGREARRQTSGGGSHAQVKSRFGKRLRGEKPRQEDLQTFIAAWGVTEPAMVKFLIGIGVKGGALRQIDKTMKLALMNALGADRSLSLADIEAAWKNRDVEELA